MKKGRNQKSKAAFAFAGFIYPEKSTKATENETFVQMRIVIHTCHLTGTCCVDKTQDLAREFFLYLLSFCCCVICFFVQPAKQSQLLPRWCAIHIYIYDGHITAHFQQLSAYLRRRVFISDSV